MLSVQYPPDIKQSSGFPNENSRTLPSETDDRNP